MPAPAGAGVIVGRLMSGGTPVAPLVDFAGNENGPIRARVAMAMDATALDRAIATAQGAVLVFENGDWRLPIVTGLIGAIHAPSPFQELLVVQRAASRLDRASGEAVVARLDGERVVLEGKREVVLKCGEASITLRSDGRMLLRGAYVETSSKGLNRIKGASVKIN